MFGHMPGRPNVVEELESVIKLPRDVPKRALLLFLFLTDPLRH